jgi:hypothetical protein
LLRPLNVREAGRLHGAGSDQRERLLAVPLDQMLRGRRGVSVSSQEVSLSRRPLPQ